MAKVHDVTTPRPGKDGETFWHKIGSTFTSKNGAEGELSMKLDSLPLPNEKGEVWLSLKFPRERTNNPPQEQRRGSMKDYASDDRWS